MPYYHKRARYRSDLFRYHAPKQLPYPDPEHFLLSSVRLQHHSQRLEGKSVIQCVQKFFFPYVHFLRFVLGMANFSEMVNCSCIKEVNSVFSYPDHFSKTYRYSDQLYEERKPEICLKASSILRSFSFQG